MAVQITVKEVPDPLDSVGCGCLSIMLLLVVAMPVSCAFRSVKSSMTESVKETQEEAAAAATVASKAAADATEFAANSKAESNIQKAKITALQTQQDVKAAPKAASKLNVELKKDGSEPEGAPAPVPPKASKLYNEKKGAQLLMEGLAKAAAAHKAASKLNVELKKDGSEPEGAPAPVPPKK